LFFSYRNLCTPDLDLRHGLGFVFHLLVAFAFLALSAALSRNSCFLAWLRGEGWWVIAFKRAVLHKPLKLRLECRYSRATRIVCKTAMAPLSRSLFVTALVTCAFLSAIVTVFVLIWGRVQKACFSW